MITQLDVSNAFLNGDLDDTIFMEQPPGFMDPNKPNHVCRLKRSLYGLRQAPRQRHKKLVQILVDLGFQPSAADCSLLHYQQNGMKIYCMIYVDDIFLTSTSSSFITSLIASLQQHFNEKLTIADGKAVENPTQFRSIIGSLQYLSFTRPDITFAVNRVAQFLQNPIETHWVAVKRILCYLQATRHHGLHLTKSAHYQLHVYSDADWASCVDDRKSTSGCAIFLGNNLISWHSRKQRTVAHSSTEAEYHALGAAKTEITWITTLLKEINLSPIQAPVLWCDNLGVTYLSSNPIFHSRTKHIKVDFHFVRDKVAKKEIIVRFISSKDQLADILTKPLPRQRHSFLSRRLTIRDLASST
ncbi:hypothetical protein GH714_010172 [Hevea brasiliensis]|uniref:Reverse transcriptase Ty1/copia-type domain-containing protein n=1 Tax=Hevea brasiliensis TaxID=3981 RepID=A0A6A6MEN4_HEVBR|nr:hypothetical protein GH714_010172 [Hevea brasiliensis]